MKKSRIKSRFTKTFLLLVLTGITTLVVFRILTSWVNSQKLTQGVVTISSTLLKEPQVYDKWQYFDIDGYNIKANTEAVYQYGDRLEIRGEVEEGRLVNPEIKKVGKTEWRRVLYQARLALKDRIDKALPSPVSNLLTGLVLGIEDLPDTLEENLRKSGTIHVVVVSGYNISVVAGLLLSLAKFVHRRLAIALSLAGIIIYTLLVGAEPPALRAAIMGSLTLTATALGRQRYSLYSLLTAALIMLFLDPKIAGSVSFQLSFLATLGIILFQEAILTRTKFLPFSFKEDLATTLAAQSLVIPILFYHFGSVSAISFVANATTLWIIPITTILGFALLFFSFLFWPVSILISWVIWALLILFSGAIELFSKAPFSYFSFEPGNYLVPAIYYFGLVLTLFGLHKLRASSLRRIRA